MSRICCAPLTHTRRHFVPNSRQPFYSDTVMCQTLAGLSEHSDYTETVHPSRVPQPVNFLFCAPLILESVSPTVHKGVRYFVSVFPSFTYLTAAVLSDVVFPFSLLSSALTPAEQWIIMIVNPSDQHACVDFDQFDCGEAVFRYTWRYHARQGQTNYSTLH